MSENGVPQVNPIKTTQSNSLCSRRFPDLCIYRENDDKSARIIPNPAVDCVFITEMNIGQVRKGEGNRKHGEGSGKFPAPYSATVISTAKSEGEVIFGTRLVPPHSPLPIVRRGGR